MTTPLDTSVPLSTFLATTVPSPSTSGTWSDVHEDTKTDRTVDADGNPVQPINADEIGEKNGSILQNSLSAEWLASYQALHLAAKIWTRADAAARDALGSLNALAVNDLAFKEDDQTLWYCVSVDGASASTWGALTATGDVTGPAPTVADNSLARFDGTGGKTIQESDVIVSDTGDMSGIGSISLSGTVDGVDVAGQDTVHTAHAADVTTNPHSVILAQVLTSDGGTGGAGDDITVETGDPLQFEENASVPGGVPAAGLMVLWQKDDQTLQATTDAGDVLLGQALTTVDNTIPRFDGTSGLLQNSNIVVDDGDSITIPGNLTQSEASPDRVLGDGTGSPQAIANKSAGGTYVNRLQVAGVNLWDWLFEADEDLRLRRYNAAGAFQDSMDISSADGNWSFPADISAVDATFTGLTTLGSTTVDASGNTDVGGTLDVTGIGTFDTDVNVAGDLGVGAVAGREWVTLIPSRVATTDATVTTIKTMATLGVDGQIAKLRIWVVGIGEGGNADNTDVSSTVIEIAAHRSTGTVALLTANINDARAVGGQPVGWGGVTVVVSSDDILVRVAGASGDDIQWDFSGEVQISGE